MKFKIPFLFGSINKAKQRSKIFQRFIKGKRNTLFEKQLESAGLDLSREEYLSICINGFVFSFVMVFILASTSFVLLRVDNILLFSLGLAVLFSSFVFFSRLVYPKVYDGRKQKEIERSLISVLQDMLVQLNSGIPLFSILVNISSSDYGVLSEEFEKIVRKINAGYAQVDVLEEVGENNSSVFFRRALWQISNGMRSGGDISIVVQESIKSLSEEQLIQIQTYGNKLNPTIMFYMLVSIIIPALSITFLTVLSSMIKLSSSTTMIAFWILFVVVMLIQVMFLGTIKSIRPSLL